jgi:putative nucleotidyltransferase with HDIG domain
MGTYAKLYIGAIMTLGMVCFADAMAGWNCKQPLQYLCLLAVALPASSLKVFLPGITGTLSVSYVFVLLCMLDFSYPETMLLACMAMMVQSLWRTKYRPKLIHLVFNLANIGIAVWVGNVMYHLIAGSGYMLLSVAAATTAYFLTSTLSIAAVVALTESKNLRKIWHECYFWSFPYYLVGGAISALISVCSHTFGWETTVLALPVVYVIFRSYRLYLGRLESEKCHAEEMAALHLRTIEALALAIEAKDHTTHDHLQRVQIYALELGKKMQLDDNQLQALRAASILHDIGKLAVPEHIISKPGKLTSEEFDKMKIHPVVGAEILARVQFPYDVVPIVRAHHERWNGTGYPDGLKGEEIPIGARILSTVDCLDALASDRQYRRALPLDEAMAVVVSEAGKSYEPRIVRILQENYAEWEHLARSKGPLSKVLSKDVTIANGEAPAAGFQATASSDPQPEFLLSIAAARQEAQMLYELTQDLGNSLNLHETLSVHRQPSPAPDSVRCHRRIRTAGRLPGSAVRQWRKPPAVLRLADSRRPGPLGLGGRRRQAHYQWESVRGARVSERSVEVQQPALRPGHPAGKRRRHYRRVDPLPSRHRRVYQRSPARLAGAKAQGIANH